MWKTKILGFLVLSVLTIFIISCGEEGEEGEEGTENATIQSIKQGWHMQGRNCLACHNVDLQPVRHLTIAGTIYKTNNINNPDDLTKVCGGNLKINFISGSTIIKSSDYEDPNSKGYKGKGNIFILSRKLPNIQGDYYIQITDENGNIVAVSQTAHSFTAGYYDPANPADFSNRYSCNACHSLNGTQPPIYANTNPNYCK